MNDSTAMPRILLVTHSGSLSGSVISLYNLAIRLPENGFTPIVASQFDGPVVERLRNRGIQCEVLGCKGLFGIGHMRQFCDLIKQENVDIVHLNCLTNFYRPSIRAARLCKRRVVCFVREDPETYTVRKMIKLLLPTASRIVTVSEDTMDHLFPEKRPAKGMVIPNGVDLSVFRPMESDFVQRWLKVPDGVPVIGCAASIVPRKGIHELITAAKILRDSGVEFRLVIMGGTGKRQLTIEYAEKAHRMVRDFGLSECVSIVSPREEMPEIMSSLDVFVLPSYWEGMSRTLLEAAASGTAVVATDAGGNREVIRDGVNGLLVSPGDAESLAKAIQRLLGDQDLKVKMGIESRRLAEANLDININVRRIADMYRNVIDGN